MTKTKFDVRIALREDILEKSGLRTFSDLRRASRSPENLRRLGFDDREVKTASEFASLARVFPPEIAIALLEKSATSPNEFQTWQPEKFQQTLEQSGIDRDIAVYERLRFERLKRLRNTGTPETRVRGITLDTGDSVRISDPEWAKLEGAGIETLADWAELRDQVKLDPAIAGALDAHARLSLLRASPDLVPHLIERGVTTAFDLARLTDKDAQQLANSLRSADEPIIAVRDAARNWANDVAGILFETKIAIGGPSLQGLDVTGDVMSIQSNSQCVECSQDLSAFSRFAYFVYLLRQTEKPLTEVDTILRQSLATLTPDSGRDMVSQIQICIEVLSRANPQPLTDSQKLPYERRLIVGKMRLLPLGIDNFAQQVAQALGSSSAANIAARLREALRSAPDAEGPVFTPAELQEISNQIDQRLRARLEQQVRAESAYAAATDMTIAAEVDRRFQAAVDGVTADALPLLRDAFKKRTGKTDRELFATFFIETDLPICEQVTRLDQAIRSLQAYLDDLSSQADEAGSFDYQSYEAWRGDRMATIYPELRALWRDDVLAYESGPPDRGSIVFGHSSDNPQLRKNLEAAAEIIKDAKARVENNAPVSFRDTHGVFYSDFERGFNSLDELLSANEDVQKSLAALDAYEPGQALSHLSNASRHMDSLAELVFRPSSPWIGLGAGVAAYDSLAALPLHERRQTLKELFNELASGEKAIFDPRNAQVAISGLLPDGDLQSMSTGWAVNDAYRLLDDGRIRKESVGGSRRSLKQVRYSETESRDFSNYTVKIDFELAKRLADKDRIGLAARLGSQGDRGYRLVIDREVEVTDGDEPRQLTRSYLKLERFDPDGAEELDRRFIRPEGVVEAGSEYLPVGDTFTLELHVYGGKISGALKIPGEEKFRVEANSGHFAKGTFALLAGANVAADFSNLQLDFEGSGGRPPFYAGRRETRKHKIFPYRYAQHRNGKKGMALSNLAQKELTFETGKDTRVQLAGAEVNDKQLSLFFKEGEAAVNLSELDKLLEKLLSSAFYLRYAVIPVRLAQAYQQAGDYERAANMLCIVYDDSGQGEYQREIYPRLSEAPETFVQTVGPDSRLMRLRLGEVYLALAEWHFRKDTTQSRYQARRLYERVLRLHTYSAACGCEAQLGEFTEQVVESVVELVDYLDDHRLPIDVVLNLIDVSVNSDIPVALDDLFGPRNRARASNSLTEAKNKIDTALATYRTKVREHATIPKLLGKGAILLKEAELPAAVRLGVGEQPLFPRPDESDLKVTIDDLFQTGYVSTIDYTFCVPEAPLKSQQKRTACHMLQLLRTCRNILGFTHELVPPLRFDALLRLARNFTDLALASERDLLNFRLQFEQESFSLVEAQNNLAVSEAQLAVESMNVLVAQSDVKVASLQFEQASAAASHFEGLIEAGLSSSEQLALDYARWAVVFSSLSAAASVQQLGIAAVGAVATGGASGGSSGGDVAGGLSSLATAARDSSSLASMQAGFERRQQEWEFQLQQSQFGVSIAHENLTQATIRFAIAEQVQRIAGLRRDFAMDTVQFLASKFLSSAMWVALQKIMRQQYRTRLNYAITAAFMAERALAFELQNRSLRVIRFDYFDPEKDGMLGGTELQTDLATLENTRLSFTQRKQQLSKTISLAQMMPVEFQIFRSGADLGNGQRRPAGRLAFSTLMEMFDRDFPGHYMRLIKAIKVTVVALIPPNDGIRATLRNNGLSRVVVGPPYSNAFREDTIRRNPEAVALSVPFQATGLFVLDYNDDLLLPFEGCGVATDWTFELPTLANRFDYGTITDVLFTMEYTALDSAEYRELVVERLGATFAADRVFSLRYEFPDVWYDLHHADQVVDTKRMKAIVDVRAADFPPNLRRLAGVSGRVPDITVQQIQFYVAHKEEVTFELPVGLKVKPVNATEIDASTGNTSNGLISTRQISGSAWGQAVIGKIPVGTWEFNLTGELLSQAGQPLGRPIADAFKDDEIEDMLFVISYLGSTQLV